MSDKLVKFIVGLSIAVCCACAFTFVKVPAYSKKAPDEITQSVVDETPTETDTETVTGSVVDDNTVTDNTVTDSVAVADSAEESVDETTNENE